MVSRRILLALLFTLTLTLQVSAFQAPQVTIKVALKAGAMVGSNDLTLTLTTADGSPVKDATVTLDVAMSEMDMGTDHPAVKNNGDGTYSASVKFSMAGGWRVTAHVTAADGATTKTFDFSAGAGHGMDHHMDMSGMMGRLGPWGMQRESSGTSWIPDSSPMFMKMLPNAGGFDLSAMGFISFAENDAGGPRGDHRFFSNSMLMLMGSKEAGGGTLGFSLMGSLDPVFNGEFGYPDLFQTGESAHGQQLVDYQHPHDFLDEVTLSYSHPIGKDMRAFVYGGPVGEPALGGPTFMHRPSGVEIPEAPISHHWFDSTHISWGVLTLGVNNSKWQFEGSAFNGHEPNENRYAPDPIRLDSASTRLTFNPCPELSLNASYGFLNSPEANQPGVDQHRLTAAAIWNRPMHNGDNLAITGAFGRNIVQGKNSDAFLLEGTWMTGPTSIFGRWEHVEKDELIGIPPGNYMINKFLVGGVRDLTSREGFDVGLGAYAGFYVFPSSLDAFYGKSPVTFGVFLRIRPSRMKTGM